MTGNGLVDIPPIKMLMTGGWFYFFLVLPTLLPIITVQIEVTASTAEHPSLGMYCQKSDVMLAKE